MNTIENNKLLAEFLGWEIYSKYFYRIPSNLCEHNGERKDIPLEGMVFDTNWNWLMQVVEKIFSLDIYYDKYIEHNSSMFSDGKIQLTTNINSVFEQCTEFVKWYNQQK